MDQTGLDLNANVRRCWMKKGSQRTVPLNTAQKQHTYLIGAYDWVTDQVTAQRTYRLNRHTIIDFLEFLLTDVYRDENIVLILDNAPVHHALDTQAFLSLFEARVRVIWLPKYAPELNLIERFWQHLKTTVCSHRLYRTIEALWQDVTRFVQLQNTLSYPERILFSKNFS